MLSSPDWSPARSRGVNQHRFRSVRLGGGGQVKTGAEPVTGQATRARPFTRKLRPGRLCCVFPNKQQAGPSERRALRPAAPCSGLLTPEAPGSSRRAPPSPERRVPHAAHRFLGSQAKGNGAELRCVHRSAASPRT